MRPFATKDFLFILTARFQTFLNSKYPKSMKNCAQAILLFTGYPLEPIVALEIQKSYQTQVPLAANNSKPKHAVPAAKFKHITVSRTKAKKA